MKQYIIDFSKAFDKSSIHEVIKVSLDFPEHYGKNLDALHDCLSEMSDALITLKNFDVLYSLDIIGVKILKVFEEAADTNNSIVITLE